MNKKMKIILFSSRRTSQQSFECLRTWFTEVDTVYLKWKIGYKWNTRNSDFGSSNDSTSRFTHVAALQLKCTFTSILGFAAKICFRVSSKSGDDRAKSTSVELGATKRLNLIARHRPIPRLAPVITAKVDRFQNGLVAIFETFKSRRCVRMLGRRRWQTVVTQQLS